LLHHGKRPTWAARPLYLCDRSHLRRAPEWERRPCAVSHAPWSGFRERPWFDALFLFRDPAMFGHPLTPSGKLQLISQLDEGASVRAIHNQFVLDALVVLRDGKLDNWLSEWAETSDAAIDAWWSKAVTHASPWAYLEARGEAWLYESADRCWRRLALWELEDRDRWRKNHIGAEGRISAAQTNDLDRYHSSLTRLFPWMNRHPPNSGPPTR
jgi:hypothetical protein